MLSKAFLLALVPCAALAATPTLDADSLIPTKPTGVAGSWKLDASLSDGFTSAQKGTLGVGISASKWLDGFHEADQCSEAAAAAGSCAPLWHGPQPSVIKGGNLKRKADKKREPVTFVIKDELKADKALFKAANDDLAVDGCDCEGYGGFTSALLRSRGLWKGGYLEAQISFPDVDDVKGSLWLQGNDVEISVDITKAAVSASAHVFGADDSKTSATAEHAVAVGTGKHTYGVKWDDASHNLEVYLDGDVVLTLEGSEWNPNGLGATDLSVMVDYAPHDPPPGFAAPTAAMSLHYVAAFESEASGGGAPVGECTVLKKAGVAYSGPVVAKYNNADGATPITDVAQCAQKCAENVECTYFAVNKSPSKGCVLKSNRRGSPVKHTAFLGHGTCAHPMPAGCATTNSGEGYSKFKKKNLGAFKSIKNDGGCAQKCAATAGCAYWVVHNRLGCVLNTEGAGRLQTKKGFMFQGTCTPAGSNE